MKWLRRALLELWAMLLMAGVTGFLGPFGSYLEGPFLRRFGTWLVLLAGAYVLVRPAILFWQFIARATQLPRGSLVFCGAMLSAFPMTLLWQYFGRDEVKLLGGFSGLLPFALLCAVAIMAIVSWAARADGHLRRYYQGGATGRELIDDGSGRRAESPSVQADPPQASPKIDQRAKRPRLYARLSSGFEGDVVALESEDHYVRVHGVSGSELLLLRLRDAIAEMDKVDGRQTHRGWWVAREAATKVVGEGRSRQIELANGLRVPVARDSVDELLRSGFLAN